MRRRVDSPHVEEPPAAREMGSPVLTWMPRARWPLAIATGLSGLLLTAMIWLSLWAESQPLWAETLGVRSGRLLSLLAVGYCFASSLLCYLVFWFRKRSRRDFAGRYRRWFTAVLGFTGMALLVGTGIHTVVGQLISERLPQAGWNTPTSCWVVPIGTAAVLVGPSLFKEMLAAGAGAILMLAGALSAGVVAAVRLVGPLVLEPAACDTVCELASIAALWCLFHAVWWHARHVIRVCNEPPKSMDLRAKLRRVMPTRPVRVSEGSPEVAVVETEPPTKQRRRRRPTATEGGTDGDVDTGAEMTDAERGPGLLTRACALVATPITLPARKIRTLRASLATSLAEGRERRAAKRQERLEAKEAARAAKAEAAELKRLEAEEKRSKAKEAKEAAVSAKAAAKKAADDEVAAAKAAKAQAREAAARAKAEAKAAKKGEPAKAPSKPLPPKELQPQNRTNGSQDGGTSQQDWSEEDEWSDDDEQGGGRKQRRRKKRRRNAA